MDDLIGLKALSAEEVNKALEYWQKLEPLFDTKTFTLRTGDTITTMKAKSSAAREIRE